MNWTTIAATTTDTMNPKIMTTTTMHSIAAMTTATMILMMMTTTTAMTMMKVRTIMKRKMIVTMMNTMAAIATIHTAKGASMTATSTTTNTNTNGTKMHSNMIRPETCKTIMQRQKIIIITTTKIRLDFHWRCSQ